MNEQDYITWINPWSQIEPTTYCSYSNPRATSFILSSTIVPLDNRHILLLSNLSYKLWIIFWSSTLNLGILTEGESLSQVDSTTLKWAVDDRREEKSDVNDIPQSDADRPADTELPETDVDKPGTAGTDRSDTEVPETDTDDLQRWKPYSHFADKSMIAEATVIQSAFFFLDYPDMPLTTLVFWNSY